MRSLRFKTLLTLFVGMLSLSSWAATELRAIALRAYALYEGPSEDHGKSDLKVTKGEFLWVQGTSVGGSWIRVVKSTGGNGWIPRAEVEIERVPTADVWQVHQVLEQEARYKSLFNFDVSLSSGSMPFGKGIIASATLNLAPGGLLGVNRDQFEVGALAAYYLGKEVFGYVIDDDTKYRLNTPGNKDFMTYGFFGQWLFRTGDRGSFMVGPRGGFLMTRYNHYESYAAPITLGVVARYFSEEHWGWTASAQLSVETSVYFFYTLGFGYRI